MIREVSGARYPPGRWVEGLTMPAILLPNGKLLIPVEMDDPAEGFTLKEIGADHPDFARWLATAQEGEDPQLQSRQ